MIKFTSSEVAQEQNRQPHYTRTHHPNIFVEEGAGMKLGLHHTFRKMDRAKADLPHAPHHHSAFHEPIHVGHVPAHTVNLSYTWHDKMGPNPPNVLPHGQSLLLNQ